MNLPEVNARMTPEAIAHLLTRIEALTGWRFVPRSNVHGQPRITLDRESPDGTVAIEHVLTRHHGSPWRADRVPGA